MLTKKDLEHLASLARIELKKGEEERLLSDLEKILGHFEELKEIDTENVPPMSGGTFEKNILRANGEGRALPRDGAISDFPESKNGFLKIPPVF
jgi:aspartyl-tRNA(Asn)/glutamyl-tRNA(Gln) amidotransferase subunit C